MERNINVFKIPVKQLYPLVATNWIKSLFIEVLKFRWDFLWHIKQDHYCLYLDNQVKDHLFDDSEIGIDLIAINMQRGRDHGLPGYIYYKRLCNPGENFNTFEDLRKDMTQQVVYCRFSPIWAHKECFVFFYPSRLWSEVGVPEKASNRYHRSLLNYRGAIKGYFVLVTQVIIHLKKRK